MSNIQLPIQHPASPSREMIADGIADGARVAPGRSTWLAANVVTFTLAGITRDHAKMTNVYGNNSKVALSPCSVSPSRKSWLGRCSFENVFFEKDVLAVSCASLYHTCTCPACENLHNPAFCSSTYARMLLSCIHSSTSPPERRTRGLFCFEAHLLGRKSARSTKARTGHRFPV